jgi:hypothetical protein
MCGYETLFEIRKRLGKCLATLQGKSTAYRCRLENKR